MNENNPDTTPEVDTATAVAAEIPLEATEPAEGVDAAGPTDTGDIGDSGDDATPANREAAKWRVKYRALESDHAALAERLAVVQRGEAERLAAAVLGDGADLWRDGADVTAVLDDAGNVDTAKVKELAAATAAAHPHWRRTAAPKGIRRNINASGATGTGDIRPPSWSEVLQRGNRQIASRMEGQRVGQASTR